MKSRLLLIVVIAIWMSCSDQHSIAPLPVGVASFESMDDLKTTITEVTEMSGEEFREWESQKGFKSFYTHWREANDEFEGVDSDVELATFLRKYGDIVSFENGELLPKLDDPIYQRIVNRQGFYQTMNVMNRVIGDRIYYTKLDDWSKLTSFNPANAEQENIQSLSYKLPGGSFEVTASGRTASACMGQMVANVEVDVGGCTGDRQSWIRVEGNLISGQIYFELDDGQPYYLNSRQMSMYFTVWGRKKNVWCNWKEYETQLEWHGITYTMTAWVNYDYIYYNGTVIQTYSTPTPFSGTVPDYYGTGNEYQHIAARFLGDATINETWPANPPSAATMWGKTRGVGVQYAAIQCP